MQDYGCIRSAEASSKTLDKSRKPIHYLLPIHASFKIAILLVLLLIFIDKNIQVAGNKIVNIIIAITDIPFPQDLINIDK